MKPLLRFRVYPARGSLYFLVTVFRTKKEMHAYCKAGKCRNGYTSGSGGNWEGICHSYQKIAVFSDGQRMRSVLGEIHLYQKGLTMETVTHESAHAGLAWFRRKHPGVDPNVSMDVEERLCYATGYVATAIVQRTQHLFP